MTKYLTTIGMEVHCELKTNAKMFSNSKNSFSEVANSNINVIDLGYPGILPKLNQKGIEYGLMASLALNCKINKLMHFDRKNYFYPDLPKGYQITQSKTPIGYDGYVEIDNKKIRLERVHLEEDTCKSIHNNNSTYLNFNRAGVPLIEIVTKPDIETEDEAVQYLTKLREILLYIGVSDVKMEEGSMRCEANISVRPEGTDTLGTKIEIKNIGSISAVKRAIKYERERQINLLEKGEKLTEETRRFDEATETTVLMRTKETGNQYRYFPEPDLPYIELEDEYIEEIKNKMPILPEKLTEIYLDKGISEVNIKIILGNIELSTYFNKFLNENINLVILSNILTGDISSYLNKNNLSINDLKITKDNLIKVVNKLDKKEISSKILKDILEEILTTNKDIDSLLKENNLTLISDEATLIKIINKIIDDNPRCLNEKDKASKYLMGFIMKETSGKADPSITSKLLVSELNKR